MSRKRRGLSRTAGGREGICQQGSKGMEVVVAKSLVSFCVTFPHLPRRRWCLSPYHQGGREERALRSILFGRRCVGPASGWEQSQQLLTNNCPLLMCWQRLAWGRETGGRGKKQRQWEEEREGGGHVVDRPQMLRRLMSPSR